MPPKRYYVYILASERNGTLYIGFTGHLSQRITAHKEEHVKGFTAKYHIHKLVYLESYGSPLEALNREKQLKKWKREWKLEMIEKMNPSWEDLSEQVEYFM